MRLRIHLVVGFLLLSVVSWAQLWTNVLAPNRAIDWTTAGISGGIPSGSWTQCGATIASGASVATINNALAGTGAGYTGCSTPYYIKLGAGTFPQGIHWTKNNVALRGSGADQTTISSGSGGICSGGFGYTSAVAICTTDSSGIGGSASFNWTAGYAKGATSLTVSGTTGINTDGSTLVFLDQCDDGFSGANCATGSFADTGNYVVCAAACATESSSSNAFRTLRSQVQIVEPTVKTSNSLTIPSPGLHAPNWRTGQTPGLWIMQSIQNAGIEDLAINTTTGGADGLLIWGCYKCWMSGVKFTGPTSGPKSAVRVIMSAHVQIQNNYIHMNQSRPQDPYPIQLQITSDTLVVNNICQQCVSPITMSGPSSGDVFAYNFTILNNAGSQGSWSFWNHSSGIDYQLWEGNVAGGFADDGIHGSHNMITRFRNRFSGQESTNSNQINPMFEAPYVRYGNIIGNVLGTASFDALYEATFDAPSNMIYVMGSQPLVPDDPLVSSTAMRWGNWDTVTNDVRWCTANATPIAACTANEKGNGATTYPGLASPSQTLPASFFYSAKPLWWPTAKAWPPIGPDVAGGNIANTGGHANTIPAQDCYTSMGGPANGSGSALTFNAATCYSVTAPPQYTITAFKLGTGSGSIVSTPTGVNCGATCSYAFNPATSMTITTSTSDLFRGWGGNCGCSGTGSCTFTLNYSCSVSANFKQRGPHVKGNVFFKGSARLVGPTDHSTDNPLTYTARTDTLETLSYLGRTSDTPPSVSTDGTGLVGVNTIVEDPDFHSRIVRCTDYGSTSNGIAYSVVGMWHMGSTGNIPRWNADSTLVMVNQGSGGGYRIITFNPATMQCGLTGIGSTGTIVFGAGQNTLGGSAYSTDVSDPNVMYELVGDDSFDISTGVHCTSPGVGTCAYATLINKLTLDRSDPNPGNWTYTRTKLFDFNCEGASCPTTSAHQNIGAGVNTGTDSPNCLPANYASSWSGVFKSSDDGQSFSIGLGDEGQDQHPLHPNTCSGSSAGNCTGSVYLANYTIGQGCRVWNTLGKQITGDWGAVGTVLDENGSPLLDNPIMHEGQGLPDSRFAALGPSQTASKTVSSLNCDDTSCVVTTSAAFNIDATQRVTFTSVSPATWLNGNIYTVSVGYSTAAPWTFTIPAAGHNTSGAQAQTAGTVLVASDKCPSTTTYCNAMWWEIATRTVRTCSATSCQGHAANGFINSYRATYYKAHTYADPTLPVGHPQLLPFSLNYDQHGSYNNAAGMDLAPVFFVTANVCNQPVGDVGAGACEAAYSQAWDGEVVSIENWITRAPSGADCNYGTGNVGCVYRHGHTFNSFTSWSFQAQNAIGNVSGDGKWLIFPSDWKSAGGAGGLGCTNGTGNGATGGDGRTCPIPSTDSVCLSSPYNNKSCPRFDLFIMDLQSAHP